MEESVKSKMEKSALLDNEIQDSDEINPQKIVKVIEPIINSNSLPNDKKVERIVEFIGITQEAYAGPLPHPKILKGYQDIVSDSPERILRMAEKQLEHRIDMQKEMLSQSKYSLEHNVKANRRTQIIAAFLLLVLIFVGTLLTKLGYQIVGSVIFGTTIIGVASIFVTGSLQKHKKMDDDNKEQ